MHKEKSKVIFSIDTELAWGRIHHRDLNDYQDLLSKYREAIDWLICVFEKYEIRATWAVVGHLFLEECSSPPHQNLTKPEYEWVDGDWYQFDPCSSFKSDPFFYAPDIIQKVLESNIHHEIGSHSFAHINFSDPGCSYQAAFDDLRECQKVYKKTLPGSLVSFVYPQDKVGNLQALSDSGFKIYRGAGMYEDLRNSPKYKRLLFLIKLSLGVSNDPVSPIYDNNLINIPLSYHFRLEPFDLSNPYSYVPLVSKYFSLKNGIKKAIDRKKIAHIGLHPIDFGLHSIKFRNYFERILGFIAEHREKGLIETSVMSDYVNK